ncbi:hypothetical protein ACFLYB_04500 [Chloroflexota bacterium]
METIKDIVFWLRWLVMTPRARYAYLWHRSYPPVEVRNKNR